MPSCAEAAREVSYISASLSFLYEASIGNPLSAALIPLGAYALEKIGESLKNEKMSQLGSAILATNVVSTPVALVGRTVCYLAGGAALGKAAGVVSMVVVTGACLKMITSFTSGVGNVLSRARSGSPSLPPL